MYTFTGGVPETSVYFSLNLFTGRTGFTLSRTLWRGGAYGTDPNLDGYTPVAWATIEVPWATSQQIR
ncbi:hypothetical protein TorRG33x02_097330 [Trema orientale]|uniref:Uncharacterized protein n=1 Tax=Trema orientale TaxID=63057 RepID=A0A2P5F9M4_TREOI|nr:hypothetical protein TorRG33x02_097330 [Trema orientale]